VEQNIQTLPSDKPIVFICSTGARSGESYYLVRDLRPDIKKVYFVEAEVTFNKDGSFKIVEPT
jgi:rhodanese-related sulfurtransferase